MGISIWHLLILAGIALLFFGPARLPGLGRSIGEAIRGFKQGLSGEGDIDVTNSLKNPQLANKQAQQTATQPQTENEKQNL